MAVRFSSELRCLCNEIEELIDWYVLEVGEQLANSNLSGNVFPFYRKIITSTLSPKSVQKLDADVALMSARRAYLNVSALLLDYYVCEVTAYLDDYKDHISDLDDIVPDIKEYTILTIKAKEQLNAMAHLSDEKLLSSYKSLCVYVERLRDCHSSLKITKDKCGEKLLSLDAEFRQSFWIRHKSEIIISLICGFVVTVLGGITLMYLDKYYFSGTRNGRQCLKADCVFHGNQIEEVLNTNKVIRLGVSQHGQVPATQ